MVIPALVVTTLLSDTLSTMIQFAILAPTIILALIVEVQLNQD